MKGHVGTTEEVLGTSFYFLLGAGFSLTLWA
jgi:hypothetical protein